MALTVSLSQDVPDCRDTERERLVAQFTSLLITTSSLSSKSSPTTDEPAAAVAVRANNSGLRSKPKLKPDSISSSLSEPTAAAAAVAEGCLSRLVSFLAGRITTGGGGGGVACLPAVDLPLVSHG